MSVDAVLARLSGRGLVTAAAALFLALVVSLGVSRCQLSNERERHAAAALRADSTAAANDSTRILSANSIRKVLGDSIAGVERRAIQQKQRADALDKALGRERISRTNLTAVIDSLSTVVAGSMRSDSGAAGDEVRRASFSVREEPYTAAADVSLWPDTLSARDSLHLRVTLDPATLDVRNGCGAAVDGIRPATTSVTGPRWLSITLGRVEQDPSLCRSPALEKPGVSRTKYFTIGTAIGVVACYFICPARHQ